MSFFDDFNAIVIPRLQAAIPIWGAMVATGHATYQQADSEILHSASKYGAFRLSKRDFQALDDFIAAELLRTITAAERMIANVHQYGAKAVAKALLKKQDQELSTIFATVLTNG